MRPIKILSSVLIAMLVTASVFAQTEKSAQLEQAFAEHFAEDWLSAWNAHDLERIFSHYTDDFEMTSPNIARGQFSDDGKLKGKEAISQYWGRALGPDSKLHFTLVDVLVAMRSLTIYYKNQNGRAVAEVFYFNDEGLVYRSAAHYSLPKD